VILGSSYANVQLWTEAVINGDAMEMRRSLNAVLALRDLFTNISEEIFLKLGLHQSRQDGVKQAQLGAMKPSAICNKS
jgi:hypothetical protein